MFERLWLKKHKHCSHINMDVKWLSSYKEAQPVLLRLYLNVYNGEETGCGASKTNTDVHSCQQLSSYLWLFTEASKKCVLPSLYCFLCVLTLVPLLVRTNAPFSKEMLNSSDWRERKSAALHPSDKVAPSLSFCLCACHTVKMCVFVCATTRLCLPRRCDRTGVRWAAAFWSWVLPQSCQKVKSLLWIPGSSLQRNTLYGTSAKTKTHSRSHVSDPAVGILSRDCCWTSYSLCGCWWDSLFHPFLCHI